MFEPVEITITTLDSFIYIGHFILSLGDTTHILYSTIGSDRLQGIDGLAVIDKISFERMGHKITIHQETFRMVEHCRNPGFVAKQSSRPITFFLSDTSTGRFTLHMD